MRVETLAMLASLFFSLTCNTLFWHAAIGNRSLAQAGTLAFAVGLFVVLTALHYLLLALLMNRWTAKILLGFLIVTTAFVTYYMNAFTVFINPDMLRNVVQTDMREASELFNPGMLPHLFLYAALPLAVLWQIRLRHDRLGRALLIRTATIVVALITAAGGLALTFHDLAPMMRNNKEIRYLITPANYLYSTTRVFAKKANDANKVRTAIGLDAKTNTAAWGARKKPALFVIVVGETARAANWGLNGYSRQTTPELAQREVINFTQATSCGTNTEVSLPCMFSVFGRRNYDEDKIQHTENVLDVLKRAGFTVTWRDNQSGCKGVCAGVTEQRLDSAKLPELCRDGYCLDEILLHGLDEVLADSHGNQVLVLHQLGNHGPAYFKRYPDNLRRFEPTCDTGDIAKCSQEAVINTYDNALLYTDHMLAQTIDYLKARQDRYDTAMIYLSDHGESLGEKGIYLHGLPYSIAPKEQTHVPMVMWFSGGYASNFKLDTQCLKQRATQPASQDNLFHTVLGLLDVQTAVYDPAMDLARNCRPASAG